ncbi:potassium transporter Kup [Methylovulum psychrotolerans]|uniref:Probable potassium transport system protein Kup n=1 Tax=Methylovulum psychrotolerans TaxID=1704499 RepID=A0A1Z4C0L3_9GAMM|nr:potassium transporter Kup [Methylovulum psychrotolerans]ASF47066.1 potassium transporter Kup [Methylovulum psychrotolerans]POZ52774.1 potassium transporter Kup [Methylovulum psychrotolerans]
MSSQTHEHQPSNGLMALMLGAIGVVYGDVGTSPLYTMKEIFNGPHAVAATPENILGILSLIFWSLIMVISIKYVLFVMRANNRGEGGIMALMALALRHRNQQRQRNVIIALGLFGTALFYGDGIITPAISVLSAVEGLQVAAPGLEAYVLPITIIVLIGLFMFQSYGTEKVGLLFGPIMLVWFGVLAVMGGLSISQNPAVLEALNPLYGLHFFLEHGWHAFIALGAVVLALTGAEALYADMGHFGKRPIQLAWFSLILPALAVNYFGQGALILRDPTAILNPFYLLAPSWAMYPLIGLATCATVIASQAVISGAFSITSQAMQMDYIPRMQRVHTSTEAIGQIYVPTMNRTLLLLVICTVLGFGSSGNLAAAYGLAVTGTMMITTLLTLIVALDSWQWQPKWVYPLVAVFLVIDSAYLGANVLKIPQGGWFPLLIGGVLFLLMSTWRQGREVVTYHLQKAAMSLTKFIDSLSAKPPLARVPGTAVYMSARNLSMPHALQINYAHNQVLHERIVLLTIATEDVPTLLDKERVDIDALAQGFYRVTARHGFMETPNVPKILGLCRLLGLDIDMASASFFIGKETLIPSDKADLNPWQEKIFLFMFRNASSPIQFFKIPPERVVELGVQFEV